jgi:twinfilin-like protein
VSYVPDGSQVRKRMLFASSHDRCKKELGASYFVSELHGSEPAELTWPAYLEHVAASRMVRRDDAMSATERALVREAVQEVDSGGANVHAVRFPASATVREALASGDALVVLRLDLAAETIEVAERAAAVPIDELPAHIDRQEPRFVVYRWAHEHDGAAVSSTVFVYSCPEGAPVKAKMSYSTAKARFSCCVRLLRILRFEKFTYSHKYSTF